MWARRSRSESRSEVLGSAMNKRLLLLILGIVMPSLNCGRANPNAPLASDEQIKAIFFQNRSEFEKIRSMIDEDNLVGRLYTDYVDSKTLSPSRLVEYRTIMKVIGIKRILAKGTSKPFYLLVDSVGMLDIGASKSIYYGTGPEESSGPLDQSCFDPGETQSSCSGARHLTDNWWIIREEFQ